MRASTLVESSMIGATRVRNADLTVKTLGPVTSSEAPRDVNVYHKTNPKHTSRELMKYVLASQRAFQDCIFLARGCGQGPVVPCKFGCDASGQSYRARATRSSALTTIRFQGRQACQSYLRQLQGPSAVDSYG